MHVRLIAHEHSLRSLTFYGGILRGEHLQERGLAGIAGEVTDVRHQVAQAGRAALQEVGDQSNVGVKLGNLHTKHGQLALVQL